MQGKKDKKNRLMKQAGYASVAVAGTLIVLKAVTFLVTGSVAILSSLFDSIQDMMTSFVNMVAIRHATEPADKDHRFGHGKAQAIGSLIQAFIIFVAALFLLFESVDRWCHPKPLTQMGLGIGMTVFAIILTIVLVRFQSYVIRQTESLSIKADQAHYTGDILMNGGVILSMIISEQTGWFQLDALFGMGVSAYLVWVIFPIVKDSFAMLMDREMSDDFRKQITEIVVSFPGVLGLRDLRTRQSGSDAFVQFCVLMDETLTLRQAHDLTDKIESRLRERFPGTDVIIHPEPERNEK